MAMQKTVAEIGRKWADITPTKVEEYKRGVAKPKKDWHDETVAAEERWRKAMLDQKVLQRHADNVAKTTTAEVQAKTILKAPNWQLGVSQSKSDYERGIEPYVNGIDPSKLPAKGGKRDFVAMQNRIMANIKQFTDIKDTIG